MGPVGKFAAAIEFGSKEAYSMAIRNKYGDRPGQDDAIGVAKKNGMKQDEGNKKLGAIEKRLAELETF